MNKNTYRLRKIIPFLRIFMGMGLVVCGVLAFFYTENIGITEVGIYGTLILFSTFWFFFGWLGIKTISTEEKVFNEFGEEGVKELRKNYQAFNWRRIENKTTQPVAGGNAVR